MFWAIHYNAATTIFPVIPSLNDTFAKLHILSLHRGPIKSLSRNSRDNPFDIIMTSAKFFPGSVKKQQRTLTEIFYIKEVLHNFIAAFLHVVLQ